MAINFNSTPYYDDFDPSKNFHRILFKPGVAVQARELTQSQTILQNQISDFAGAIFSQNTPVSGGQVTTNLNCYYIKLNYTNPNGLSVTAANFENQVIMDPTGTVLARVIATVETTSSGSTVGDPPTLIVSYLSGQQFTDGTTITTTTLQIPQTAIVATSIPASQNYSTGLSSTASIANGVFYIVNGYSVSPTTGETYSIGNFVNVNPQTIVLDKYDNTPSYRIGLEITETVYDYIDDSSLLDPAIGASNYQAPGADRYVVNLTLVALPLTLGNDDGFIELVRIVNGEIIKQVDGTVYSTIDDYFAKRDYETNGDYVVYDFTLTPGANSIPAINASNYNLGISKGVAYVHGYRVENQSQLTLVNSRAQTTANVTNNSVQPDYGNYFVVDTLSGIFDVTTMPQVDLHCVTASNITTSGQAAYNSTLVGTSFLRNLSYVSGSGSSTILNAYVSDINFNSLTGAVSGSGANSTAFVINDTNSIFSTVANAYYGITVSVTTSGVTDTRTITSYSGTSTKTVNVSVPFTVTPTSSSTFTLLFQPTNVNAIVKNANNTIGTIGNGSYTLTANTNINSTYGKVSGVSTGQTILNSPGSPEMIFQLGYPYVSQVGNSVYYSTRMFRGKTFNGSGVLQLTASENYTSNYIKFEQSGTLSPSQALTNFIVFDSTTNKILDFQTSGNTVSVSSDHLTATLTGSAYAGRTVDVLAQVQVVMPTGTDTNPILKAKNLISGNTTTISSSLTQVGSTGTYVDLSEGQILVPKSVISSGVKNSLYITDAKNIAKIIDLGSTTTSPSGSLSNYTDITSSFRLDNGQRDSYYDHASVTLVPGAAVPSGNILVVLNYYSHTTNPGDGFFSIESYANTSSSIFGGGVGVSANPEQYPLIPTYTATDGNVYKLSDCIDFRPSRQNAQTSYVWENTTGAQPGGTSDIGILIPQNLSTYSSTYYYYLGRKDQLVLTKDKSFQIIQGTPSTNPIPPSTPSGALLLANLTHDPFTAYVPGENPPGVVANLSVNKVVHKRWAKNDISDLESRVNNLEYYTSLSMLEQNAASQQVLDNLGVARPNYGILVDDFGSFSTADSSNQDYLANINIRHGRMTALEIVDNFQLQNPVALATYGTLNTTNTYAINSINAGQTNIFTLPYTTNSVVVQQLASDAISVNPFNVVSQQGIAQLNPPMDNWVDNNIAPSILVSDPSQQLFQQNGGVSVVNAGDMQSLVGTANYLPVNASQLIPASALSALSGSSSIPTQAYSSQTITSPSSGISSALSVTNGYVTNTSVLPYIRPQQIIVRASKMLLNTPVSIWFDGVNINQYMTAPNTIELSNVSGTFNQDDVVGFYLGSTAPYFFPVARVLGVYYYPNTTNARLYVADVIIHTTTFGSTTLQNATFNSDGSYASSSASGTLTAGEQIINQQSFEQIAGIGQTYTSTANTSISATVVYPVTNGSYCSFLNNHGIWGSPNFNTANFTGSFPFYANTAGSYLITAAVDNNATISIDGSQVMQIGSGSGDSNASNYNQTSTTNVTLTSGLHTISWNANNTGGPGSFGAVISGPTGAIVFDTVAPPTISYNEVGSTVALPDGGLYVTGVTQIVLPPTAPTSNTIYASATVYIDSTYTYDVVTAASPVSTTSTSGGGGGLLGGILQGVGGIVTTVVSAAGSIVSGIGNAIGNVVSSVGSGISKAIKSIFSFF